jgi:hypothetical protein
MRLSLMFFFSFVGKAKPFRTECGKPQPLIADC